MTLSDPVRRDRKVLYQADLLDNASTVWPSTIKFGRITHRKGLFLGAQPRLTVKGAGHAPQRSPIRGFPSIYAHTLRRRTTKFDAVTHMRRGLFLCGKPRPRFIEAEPQRSPIFEIPSFWLHRITHNDHVRQGNTWGRGVFLGVRYASRPIEAEAQRPTISWFPSIYVYTLRHIGTAETAAH